MVIVVNVLMLPQLYVQELLENSSLEDQELLKVILIDRHLRKSHALLFIESADRHIIAVQNVL